MTHAGIARRSLIRAGGVMLCWACLAAGGCAFGALVGGMAQSYQESSTEPVEAAYKGLESKSYAVGVVVDRSIEAMYPGIGVELTQRINERLHAESGATGWIPTTDLVRYLTNNPRWTARPRSELAAELGVDRLVIVELSEFHLNDPGNQYLWAGVAQGRVEVVERDALAGDLPAFDRLVTVRFPDKSGYGPMEMSATLVSSTLVKRFVDRTTWNFYKHEEPMIRNPNY